MDTYRICVSEDGGPSDVIAEGLSRAYADSECGELQRSARTRYVHGITVHRKEYWVEEEEPEEVDE